MIAKYSTVSSARFFIYSKIIGLPRYAYEPIEAVVNGTEARRVALNERDFQTPSTQLPVQPPPSVLASKNNPCLEYDTAYPEHLHLPGEFESR